MIFAPLYFSHFNFNTYLFTVDIYCNFNCSIVHSIIQSKKKKVNLVLPSRYVDLNKNPKIKKSRSSADFAESTNNDLLRDICKSKQQLILLNVFTKSYIVCNLIQLGYHRRREIRELEHSQARWNIWGQCSGDLSPLIFDR